MMAQGGKTQGFFNVIGHRLDDDPVPILYIGPTKSNITNVIEPKVDEMLRSCKSLWAKTIKGKKYTTFKKTISGVTLRFAWAGSPTELAADSAGIVLVDEVDRIDKDIKGEGNIIDLADARHASFPDGKTLAVSTPTVGNVQTYIHPETGLEHWEVSDDIESPIWRLWQGGTRHEWSWPCPDCHSYFVPRLKLLWWPEKSTPEQAERDAKLTCPHCGSQIDSKHKTRMNALGVYVSPGQSVNQNGEVIGEEPESKDATFWVSGICSFASKKTFGFLAAKFIRAARSHDPESVKGVLNTQFGECFRIGGDAPSWQHVLSLRSPYKQGEVPNGVRFITCGVDVQKDRLIYSIKGWGLGVSSWVVRQGELFGETEHNAVWLELENLLQTPLGDRVIQLMGIDSGYRPGDKYQVPTNQIYRFCRKHKGRARPTKGHAEQDKPIKPSLIDISIDGRTFKKGLKLWHLDTDYFKTFVHTRLEWPEGEPGAWLLPEDITEDYCKQVTAESRVVKPSGKSTWISIRRDNHFLDCEVINLALAHMLQIHTLPVTEDEAASVKPKTGRRMRNRGIQR